MKAKHIQTLDVLLQVGHSNDGNEYIKFDLKQALRCVLEGSGLDKVTDPNNPVCLSQVMDGSYFTSSIGFVMYGIKMNDPRALDPWTKLPIIDPSSLKSILQSRNNQVPLKIIIGKEKDAIYEEFQHLFFYLHEYVNNNE